MAALAIVLMLPGFVDSSLLLPCLTTSLRMNSASDRKDDCYEKLLKCLSSCITLSCIPEGIESLLCSVFFEPAVPCNLIGAHLLGVGNAIKPLEDDPWILTVLMTKKAPMTLWLATIWSRRVSNVLTSVMGGLPPISLPVASWTGTIQSFVQAGYYSITDRLDFIPRAREYSVAYLIRPDIVMPFTPSPPFGETPTSNLSLDVRMHLKHCHRPLLHRTSWMLNTGEELSDQQDSKVMPQLDVHLPITARSKYIEEVMSKYVVINYTD